MGSAWFTHRMTFLPRQVEQGLVGVVTGIGAAFIENQTVLLESEQRGHVGETGRAGEPEEAEEKAICYYL